MQSDSVITAEGLGKKYVIGHRVRERSTTLRDEIARHAKNFARSAGEMARGRAIVAGDDLEEFWALRDVDFAIPRGDVVGIIGRNGAGKSTLLKLLSRITEPSEGRITIRGRVASLLEVGTGFHHELTGRENIYLNGAVLGMTRAEIRRKFDEIVDFSGVEKFLDTPVKRYSSGMTVRLAFSVAAHLEPEILVVDEVLAVGDAQFQNKCLGKMRDVSGHGRTVLFVSHNIGAIRNLCRSGIVLEQGRLMMASTIEEAIGAYMASNDVHQANRTEWDYPGETGPGGEVIRLTGVRISGQSSPGPIFRPDEAITVRLLYHQKAAVPGLRLNLRLVTESGEVAFVTTDQPERPRLLQPGYYESRCIIPGGLLNRTTYTMGLTVRVPKQDVHLPLTELGSFAIEGVGNESQTEMLPQWPGVVCPKISWAVSPLQKARLAS